MSIKKFTAAERKAQLLDVGARLAAKHGAKNVARRMVANAVKPKIAESLVTAHMGNNDVAQRAYARHAKKLGLVQPSHTDQVAIGTKLRAHGPRDTRNVRQRSIKEVEAIARKRAIAAAPAAAKKTPKPREVKPAAPESAPVNTASITPTAKPDNAAVIQPPERKTAARQPKAPPAAAV